MGATTVVLAVARTILVRDIHSSASGRLVACAVSSGSTVTSTVTSTAGVDGSVTAAVVRVDVKWSITAVLAVAGIVRSHRDEAFLHAERRAVCTESMAFSPWWLFEGWHEYPHCYRCF